MIRRSIKICYNFSSSMYLAAFLNMHDSEARLPRLLTYYPSSVFRTKFVLTTLYISQFYAAVSNVCQVSFTICFKFLYILQQWFSDLRLQTQVFSDVSITTARRAEKNKIIVIHGDNIHNIIVYKLCFISSADATNYTHITI